MNRSRSKSFRLLPAMLLATMLLIAMVMEWAILDPPEGLLLLWLTKAPLIVLLAWPWLRRHQAPRDLEARRSPESR